jgi:Ca2+-binding RTX toxin-like protein
MATYTFESMTQSDASAFTTADFLVFSSTALSALGVTDNPETTTSNALGTSTTFETITLTANGKSLTFDPAVLSATSQETSPQHIVFSNDLADMLVLGYSGHPNGSQNDVLTVGGGVAGHHAVAFGFGGNDTITGGAANDTLNGGEGDDSIVGSSSTHTTAGAYTESDWLLGGNGNDTIAGGAGNDHIYGNVAIGAAGTADGNDVLTGGAGNDYINGNAGNDTIDGGTGNDRLYGGSGADSIVGNDGNDYLQGNKGNDTLDGGNGNDTIHGGADNDTITDGAGSNQLWGDAGADTITSSGSGNDTISGGLGYDHLVHASTATGHDTFVFAAGDADIANFSTATTAAGHDLTDDISGFVHGGDKLSLGFSVAAVDTSSTTFATADDALTFAKTLLAGHGNHVAALEVNDTAGGHVGTYVFWDSAHSTGTVDSAVLLDAITHTSVTATDFV